MQIPLFEASRSGQIGPGATQVTPYIDDPSLAAPPPDRSAELAAAQMNDERRQKMKQAGLQLTQYAVQAGASIRFNMGKQRAAVSEENEEEEPEETTQRLSGALEASISDPEGLAAFQNGDTTGISFDAEAFGSAATSFRDLNAMLAMVSYEHAPEIIRAATESIYEHSRGRAGILARGDFRKWLENEMGELESASYLRRFQAETELNLQNLQTSFNEYLENGQLQGALEVVNDALSGGLISSREAALMETQAHQLAPLNRARIGANEQFRAGLDEADAYFDAVMSAEGLSPAQKDDFEGWFFQRRNQYISQRQSESQRQIRETDNVMFREYVTNPSVLSPQWITAHGLARTDPEFDGGLGQSRESMWWDLLLAGEADPSSVQDSVEAGWMAEISEMLRQGIPFPRIEAYINRVAEEAHDQHGWVLGEEINRFFRSSLDTAEAPGYADQRAGGEFNDAIKDIDDFFQALIVEADDDYALVRHIVQQRDATRRQYSQYIAELFARNDLTLEQKRDRMNEITSNLMARVFALEAEAVTESFNAEAATRDTLFNADRREAINTQRQIQNGVFEGNSIGEFGIVNLHEMVTMTWNQTVPQWVSSTPVVDSTQQKSWFVEARTREGQVRNGLSGEIPSSFLSYADSNSPGMTPGSAYMEFGYIVRDNDFVLAARSRRSGNDEGSWVVVQDNPALIAALESCGFEPPEQPAAPSGTGTGLEPTESQRQELIRRYGYDPTTRRYDPTARPGPATRAR